ncbi:hypothetical protein ABPG72_018378 [Tetrahymena utriculariae]
MFSQYNPYPMQVQAPQRPLMIFQKQRNGIKNQMYQAIKDGNFEKVKQILKEYDVDPNEEVSVAGYCWTALHYSCHFRQPQILEIFIHLIYKKNQNFFVDVMNIKTKEGWTPLMISCIYKSPECIKILLNYGGVYLNICDYKGSNCLQLCESFQTKECFEIIQRAMKKYQQANGLVPINLELLKQKSNLIDELQDGRANKPKEMDKATEEKYKKLLEEGYRLPCVICQVELGYIKYTDCCGQPMHGHCQTEKITSCPVCRNSNYTLRTDVIYPERAFSLEKP